MPREVFRLHTLWIGETSMNTALRSIGMYKLCRHLARSHMDEMWVSPRFPLAARRPSQALLHVSPAGFRSHEELRQTGGGTAFSKAHASVQVQDRSTQKLKRAVEATPMSLLKVHLPHPRHLSQVCLSTWFTITSAHWSTSASFILCPDVNQINSLCGAWSTR